MLTLFAFLSADADASDFVSKIGDPVAISGNGTWPRVLPRETEDGALGWTLVMARGGELYASELDEDLVEDHLTRRGLTGRTDLTDHAFVPCDDGGYLDGSSVTTTYHDDTLVIFRFDADLNLVSEHTVVQEDPYFHHNDSAAICTENLTGVGGFGADPGVVEEGDTSTFYKQNAEGSYDRLEPEDNDVGMVPLNFGGSWVWDPNNEWYTNFKSGYTTTHLETHYLDEDLRQHADLVHGQPLYGEEGDFYFWWPARSIYRDGYFWVVTVGRDAALGESDAGDLYIAIFDANYQPVDLIQLTDFGEGTGGKQPYMVIDDNHAVVSFIVDTTPTAVLVELANEQPTAQAGDDQTVTVGDTVTLDGSGSSDPEGDELTMAWSLLSVPDGSQAAISGTDTVTATFVADVVGTFVVQLTVDDGGEPVDDTLLVTAVEDSTTDSGTDDSGSDDTDGGGDDTGTGPSDDGGCARCATGPGAAGLAVLLAAGLIRRRRD